MLINMVASFMKDKDPGQLSATLPCPALPKNELNEIEAKALISNGCFCISEGANILNTPSD